MHLRHGDKKPACIRSDITRAENRSSVAEGARALPSPPAAVIGVTLLSGTRGGQHGVPPFSEAWPGEQLRATRFDASG
jgi:hypothetical protein